ncbi:hypothetical protein HN587_07545 [Candidatus Woesearchaeota archaeon]|jgi:hypothetical protein|nr:hypothetical protein [Candidatus Woesearchaeota archaeon]
MTDKSQIIKKKHMPSNFEDCVELLYSNLFCDERRMLTLLFMNGEFRTAANINSQLKTQGIDFCRRPHEFQTRVLDHLLSAGVLDVKINGQGKTYRVNEAGTQLVQPLVGHILWEVYTTLDLNMRLILGTFKGGRGTHHYESARIITGIGDLITAQPITPDTLPHTAHTISPTTSPNKEISLDAVCELVGINKVRARYVTRRLSDDNLLKTSEVDVKKAFVFCQWTAAQIWYPEISTIPPKTVKKIVDYLFSRKDSEEIAQTAIRDCLGIEDRNQVYYVVKKLVQKGCVSKTKGERDNLKLMPRAALLQTYDVLKTIEQAIQQYLSSDPNQALLRKLNQGQTNLMSQ